MIEQIFEATMWYCIGFFATIIIVIFSLIVILPIFTDVHTSFFAKSTNKYNYGDNIKSAKRQYPKK